MARPGSWRKDDYRAKCPLHVAYREDEIMCKPHLPGSTVVVHRYANVVESAKQQEIYCNGNYERCEHYLAWKHFMWEDD